ncbi:unnamed protein product, partial [Chrysoparadoxa australica]
GAVVEDEGELVMMREGDTLSCGLAWPQESQPRLSVAKNSVALGIIWTGKLLEASCLTLVPKVSLRSKGDSVCLSPTRENPLHASMLQSHLC